MTSRSKFAEIFINERQLRDVIPDAWTVLYEANRPPQVFRFSGQIARLKRVGASVRIEVVEEPSMFGMLVRAADWKRTTLGGPKDAKPPKDLVRDMIANPDSGLPELVGLVEAPIFDPAGKLIATPGYHAESGLYLAADPELEVQPVPLEPSASEVASARTLLLEDLLLDFPFASDSDRAHALAALLQPFVRRMIAGPTPIYLAEAPTPGSGKSLWADLVSIVSRGRSCEATTVSNSENELRKKITSLLLKGTDLILIDNVTCSLDSGQLAAAITAETWSDRLLGRSRIVDAPNTATWIITANNPRVSLEIARRSVRIRIDSGSERPWRRTAFKHDPIREWAREHRARLVHACLVLIQSWIAAGMPAGSTSLGSFERWASVLGGILEHVEVPGFLANTAEFYETADDEGREWRAFVEAWRHRYQGEWVSATELRDLAERTGLLGFALGDRKPHSQRVRLGKALNTQRDRRFGNWKLLVGADSHTKTTKYRLGEADPTSLRIVDPGEGMRGVRDVAGIH